MDMGVRAKVLMDMRVVYASEFKHVLERYNSISKFAL